MSETRVPYGESEEARHCGDCGKPATRWFESPTVGVLCFDCNTARRVTAEALALTAPQRMALAWKLAPAGLEPIEGNEPVRGAMPFSTQRRPRGWTS